MWQRYKKELIVKELLLTDVLKESTFFYKGEKGKVMVQVRNEEGVGDKISTVGSFDKMEKVKVRENEAAYLLWDHDKVYSQQIEWLKNGTKLSYSVMTRSKDVTKEQLIKIAESLYDAK
ncbi:DUF4367 domain-containing protein [Brevibacillus laterosporus]|nr:DUF4367 domain-containing protein [Brevibacillus laterosporus]